MANPINTLLQTMDRKTVTLGWDVVVAYNAESVNDLFAQQYVANVRANQHLPPINGTLNLSSGVTVQLVNLTLGPPLISFVPSVTDQQAIVLMNFIAGDVVVQQQSGSVEYVSAYQSIVPGDKYALQMIVELAQVQGQVTAQNVVVVNLRNADTFQANLLPGTGAASLLGTYFQSIFQKETQATLTYDLGTIVTGTSENLTPVSFDIRTQPNPNPPATNPSDGAVLLFVATTYNPKGGNLPGQSFPYLIPDGSTCALVVASKTLFGNIIQPFYESTLSGNPSLALETLSGSSPASYLAFTGGSVDAGKVTASWYSGGGITHQVWSGTKGQWSMGNPHYENISVPFNGLTLQPENYLLSMQWSHTFSQEFAATTCIPKGCTASDSSISLTLSGSFPVSPTIDKDNNVAFGGGNPSVHVHFQSSGWFSKWFGNGNARDKAGSQVASAATPTATAVLKVPLPAVDTFAVSHLLFPASNALQYAQSYLPGDLALFGAIQPSQTAFTISPLQATIGEGETQQFTVSNAQNAQNVTWTIYPRFGSISQTGLYTAPTTVTSATPVVVTATENQTDIVTAVVVVVPSPVTVSPSYIVISPNAGPTQLECAVLGNLGPPTWSISPNDGSVGTIDQNGLYTPPAKFPSGVTLATATAKTASSAFDSCILCLVDAVVAFTLTPMSVVLGPGGQQQFTVNGSGVQWSLLGSSAGTLSQSGLYTAPSRITQRETAVVMVQMSGNANFVGLGVVMLTPAS
jgi:hypothetical protein